MDTVPYPQEQDGEIRKWSSILGLSEPVATLDRIRQMIVGDVTSLDRYAEVWAPTSIRTLSDVDEMLTKQASDVDNYWTGDAASGYQDWLTKYKGGVGQFKETFGKAQVALSECASNITNSYGELIKLITRIAAELTNTWAVIESNITDIIVGGLAGADGAAAAAAGAIKKEMYRLLGVFLTEAGQLIATCMDKLREFKKTMDTLATEVAKIEDVVPMQTRVGNTGDWKVRPRQS
ncbi:hypothetical protein Lesp02_55730 [Lentzea sp. NBRC 105346]|uniref:hypothetical protein n=1 Tax=Lentzea sp. NBRC 105346 TaxID=3032205 RepID=UPI0024A04808|nr:hypothetical protein [Lentzea sp. NBRC 105346]GLZ33385.1 hypothetical protein Lesp02_55730 [Lentzea sp. NBRC 105346]